MAPASTKGTAGGTLDRMVRRLATVAFTAVLVTSACSPTRVSRAELVDSYRRELVQQGVRDGQARCLTDKFFGALTDEQLREFQQRDRLTDAEKQRFADLAEECPE